MLIVGDELNESSRTRLEWLSSRGDNFEVDSGGGMGGDGIDLPGRCLTNADFSLANTCGLLSCGDGVPDKTRYLQLLGCLISIM